MNTLTFRVRRRPQAFIGAFGVAALLLGIALLPRGAGWFCLVIGAVCTLSGATALLPGLGYVRFAPEGLTVKYMVLPARTVPWTDIADVTSVGVHQIRHTVPSMVIAYRPGYDGPKLGQRIRDGRSYVGNFTTASGGELAVHGREYLARYGGSA
jgi:hypothetical protein